MVWLPSGNIQGPTGPSGPTGPVGATGSSIDAIAVINDSLQFYSGANAVGSPVVFPGAVIDGGNPTSTSLNLIDGGTL